MVEGLSSQQVKNLLQQYGLNAIPEKGNIFVLKVVKKFLSPISLMLLAAAILSLILGKIFDFYFILLLLFINVFIALWQENKADNAIKKLNENLAQKVSVLRDGKWGEMDAKLLVPGDIVKLAAGEIVPADGKVVEATHVAINEAAVSGESLPKDKKENDPVYSGSFVTTGIAVVTITATGVHTSFGKTVFSVERIRKKSMLEKDILDISKFLSLLSILAIIILSSIFLLQKVAPLDLLSLDLSLLIAGIPTSLPTVMTLIIEFGVIALAAKNAVVRRLSALEDLANVNYVLTDKTGTLTQNKITVKDVYAYGKFTHNDVLTYAYLATAKNEHDPIDAAIAEQANILHLDSLGYETIDFIPADSDRKRSTAMLKKSGKKFTLSLGAPQVIAGLCALDKTTKEKFNREVQTLADNGFRALAVAKSLGEEKRMQLIGVIALSDTLRTDAKEVIAFLKDNVIDISMVTGDNRAIAQQIAKELGMGDEQVVPKDVLDKTKEEAFTRDFFYKTSAFAEMLPEDKLRLVERAKQLFVVAANGDGVNDLPALKAANVGIAVKNAVSVLRATADIVLLSDGISVIRDAIIESRKIFARLYTYSLYRISESLRLIVTITVLGLIYRVYPLTTLQIIVVALLNDIPIISLASDNVKVTSRPAKINAKKRFTLSSLYGLTGIANSLILFFIMTNIMHLDWKTIQTVYFLKLTVSGHMLIYVAHTKERWWKFLPSAPVIWATSLTQLVATLLALTGFLMPTHISFFWVAVAWVWSFLWMQVGEIMKVVQQKTQQ